MISAALILVGATTAMAYELARQEPRDLARRSPTVGGGFALIVGSGNTCPADTTQCNGWNCCPNSLTCHEGVANTIAASCCPPSSSCLTALVSEPFCADSTWLLYSTNSGDYSNFFCCQPGQIGVNDGSCASNQTNIASSLLASSVTAGAALATSSKSPSTTTHSAFVTSTTPSGSSSMTPNSASASTVVSGASPTSTGATQASSSGTASTSSSNSNNSSELSTGAKIGIGVGVGLGAIILALLLYLLILLNRIQRKQRSREAFAAASAPETSQRGGMENVQTQSIPGSSTYPMKQEHGGFAYPTEQKHGGYGYPTEQEHIGSAYPTKQNGYSANQEIMGDPVVEMAGRAPPAQLE